jgi:hypothetical protein
VAGSCGDRVPKTLSSVKRGAMTRKHWLFLLMIVLCISKVSLRAATVGAASCASADVQGAINSVNSGDTVLVPGGSCSWNSAVDIPSTKGITVIGGGTTTITSAKGFTIEQSATSTSRITGFNFTGQSVVGSSAVSVTGAAASSAFRIDHNTFTNSNQVIFVEVEGNAPGLIDHNVFTVGAASEVIHNYGTYDATGWADSVTPGGPNMVFIEDNTFTYPASGNPAYFWGTSAVQSYYSARTVVRYNTMNMCQIDQHGTAGMVGARWWEIYGNTFNVVANGNQSNYMAIRAGSGVIYNNHQSGSNGGGGTIELYEEDTGYPALYQIGRGINEAYSPAYVWGNDSSMNVVSGSSNVVQGRDFIVSAAQPSSMLREELSSDSASTTYTYAPYPYPHPLQSGSIGTTSLTPPSAVSASVR